MGTTIEIGPRKIGAGWPVYIVAEMSANHNQDFGQAVEIVKAAKRCGADAIKLQTYTADTLTIDCDNPCFRIGKGTIWEGKTLYDLYKEAYTPWEWQAEIKKVADDIGLDFFSTPFDETAVDFLEGIGVPAHKIASFEIVDLALIRKIAEMGKPIIVSTGMASLGEIDEAVRTIRDAGNERIVLLKCTSAYPAPPDEMNLRTIPHLSDTFSVPVGLSDHTLGIAVPVAAVALGASVIEKHFTLSREVEGPDSSFSLEPQEFAAMVDAVRMAEKACGDVSYAPGQSESASMVFRRSLFVTQTMKRGDIFGPGNVRSIRPGYGLAPKHLEEVLGKKATRDIERGTPLTWELIG